MPDKRIVETQVPARLDRLPWSRWHLLIVVALGITWLLDGLEVTLAGSLAGILQDRKALGLSAVQVGAAATAYLAGAVVGAVIFGYETDRRGRKKLFLVTLGLYLAATAATAFSWNFWSFALFRALTGAGIGGEYAAINSAIDELIPAKVRGHVDLIINSTFWIGAALGSLGAIFLLDTGLASPDLTWRFAFGIGALLGLGVLALRKWVPESPRWLILRGRVEEAELIVSDIEKEIEKEKGPLAAPPGEKLRIHVRDRTPLREIFRSMLKDHLDRSILGLFLMVGQAFFYNAIFFTYGLVLVEFFHVSSVKVAWYILPLAIGNFLGPLALGRFFDTVGRKKMITGTYAASGILLAISAYLFKEGMLTATTQALCFTVIFFIASSAASAAYLTVSEVFPLEIRAMAIAVFYALGTFAGGVGAPVLFGALIASHSATNLFWGYLLGSGLMLLAAVFEAFLGVAAEGQSLESISKPLAAS